MENTENTVHIVIPHVAEFAQWEELKFALRSIHKNYKGNTKVWIVGDKPKWLSNKVGFIKVPCTGKSPRLDVIVKIKAVLDHPDIPEEFFWSNDDIYFINKVTYFDMAVPKVIGNLQSKVKRITGKSVYTDDIKATFNTLLSEGKPYLNYSTHLPYRYEKSKFAEMIEQYDLENVRLLPENLYFNTYHADELPYHLSLDPSNNIMFCIQRPNPNWKAVEAALLTKKWMNNSESGMSEKLQKLLNRLFPDPSPYEKGFKAPALEAGD